MSNQTELISLYDYLGVMSNQTELISLYDYLGKAAGKELGGKVYQFAVIMGARTGTKTVSHSPSPQGRIMTYERRFLDQFFAVQSLFPNKTNEHELAF